MTVSGTLPGKLVLERSAPAVGVKLVKVDISDEIIGSFSAEASVNLIMADGSSRTLSAKDVTLGDRGHKVKKLGIRGQILRVDLNVKK